MVLLSLPTRMFGSTKLTDEGVAVGRGRFQTRSELDTL